MLFDVGVFWYSTILRIDLGLVRQKSPLIATSDSGRDTARSNHREISARPDAARYLKYLMWNPDPLLLPPPIPRTGLKHSLTEAMLKRNVMNRRRTDIPWCGYCQCSSLIQQNNGPSVYESPIAVLVDFLDETQVLSQDRSSLVFALSTRRCNSSSDTHWTAHPREFVSLAKASWKISSSYQLLRYIFRCEWGYEGRAIYGIWHLHQCIPYSTNHSQQNYSPRNQTLAQTSWASSSFPFKLGHNRDTAERLRTSTPFSQSPVGCQHLRQQPTTIQGIDWSGNYE